MTRIGIVLGCFGAALVSGLAVLMISDATVVPLMSRGSGPNGIQVTSGGWLALFLSIAGTGGFTLAGIVTSLASRFSVHSPDGSPDALMSEVMELTAAFYALMSDKSNRATQRRFFFALVDAARLINGCETSHDAGVVVIKYSGYADPVVPTQQGTPS